MNFRDAIFLKLLLNNNAKSKFTSMTLKNIIVQSDEYLKICGNLRLRISKMIEDGYVCEGLAYGHSKTYYITQKGIDWLAELNE